jgi:hypothetical protein
MELTSTPSPLQTAGYAAAREALGNQSITVTVGDRTVYIHRRTTRYGYSFLVVPRGLRWNTVTEASDLYAAVQAIAQPSDAWVQGEWEYPIIDPVAGPQALGPWIATRPEQPLRTVFLDLSLTNEELLKQCDEQLRRKIRAAAKVGTAAALDTDFAAYYALHQHTYAKNNLGVTKETYHQALLQHGAYLITARYNQVPMATGLIVQNGATAAYLFGGSRTVAETPALPPETPRDIKAPAAFYWEMIQECRRRGVQWLDLWGVPDSDTGASHAKGIGYFKKQFNGTYAYYPGFKAALNNRARFIWFARTATLYTKRLILYRTTKTVFE